MPSKPPKHLPHKVVANPHRLRRGREKRLSAHAMGYDNRWRKIRKIFLESNPLCVVCKRPATVVDHRVPHRGDPGLFYNEHNFQSMCKSCHDAKTAREDGGFGNEKRDTP